MNLLGTTGPQRTNWLNSRGDALYNALRYYLGPTGIPDRLMAAGNALAYTDAGDMVEAADASRAVWNDPSLETAARYATAAGALAIPFVGARMVSDGVDVVGDAVRSGVDDMRGFTRGEDGSFAGIRAKTADMDALKRAEDMTAAGAARDDIWRDTGWFQGVDGQWRFEIDDSGAAYTPDLPGSTVADAFTHSRLFDAYPEASGLPLAKDTTQELPYMSVPKGTYNATTGEITIHDDLGRKSGGSTMLHELQHHVQGVEGFGRGASPAEYASGAMFHTRARDLQGALSRELTGGLMAKPAEIADILRFGDPARLEGIAQEFGFGSLDDAMTFLRQQDEMRTPFSQYRRTAGEVEARNVQTRRDFTPDQRRATPPWTTQDVPDNQQIVRGLLQKYGLDDLLRN